MIEGVDYSFGRPGGAALAAAGKRFAVRYLPYPKDGGKGLTSAEVADLFAHGIEVGLVWERGSQAALGGRLRGITDAEAVLAALTSLGVPGTVAVYFAMDWDAQPGQYPAIDAYLRGAASVIGASLVGVYGGIRVIEHCFGVRSAAWFWQTYAWSGGKLSPRADLYQYHNGQSINGAAVDFDRSLVADWGQWSGGISAGGNVPPPPGGEEMKFINLDGANIDSTRRINVSGAADWYWLDGTKAGSVPGDAATVHALPWLGKGDSVTGSHVVALETALPYPVDDKVRPTAVLIKSTNSPYDITPPAPDCSAEVKDAVNKALDHVQPAVDAVDTAIAEARVR